MTDPRRVDVVSLQPTAIVDKCVVVESAADAIAVLETADINDTLELGGSHPLASDVEMARLLDACNAARSLPVRSSAGGSASNVLRAVASFGASARLVGARGDDADGELYERSIRDAGICADHLVVQPNRKTASCAVVSERAGMQRTMRTLFVDAARLDVGELREELLAASFCFVSSYTCYFEGMIERLIELGEAAGCSILLDLGSFEIVKRFSGRLDGLFRRVDYCVCNEDEAAAFAKVHFSGSSSDSSSDDDYKNSDDGVFDATAAWMLDHGVKSAVIITLGERGSILYEPSPAPSSLSSSSSGVTRTDVAAVRLDDGAVDPTGAGDAFCAGLLYALATRRPLHDAVKTASAAGAAAVKSVGAELSPSALQWFRDVITRT